ncbi:MAG: hypothetical protein AB7O45_04860 [Alphaproteobacteria bacterium]
MINYLSTEKHGYTIQRFVDGPGAALAGHVAAHAYEDVLARDPATLPGGVWIFTDFDRISPDAAAAAARVWRALQARGCRMLNHPTRSLRRYALLRRLRAEGINDFGAYHVSDLRLPDRYPVFIRRSDAHSGPATELLASRRKLQRILDDVRARAWPIDAFVTVEYQDTRGADGRYRKYGVMKVADRIFPVQVLTADAWINKRGTAARWTPDVVAAELAYFRDNPHREAVENVFRLAGMEYGRIDFGLTEGRIQVWEINGNPSFTGSTPRVPERAEATAIANRMLVDALLALDLAHGEAGR